MMELRIETLAFGGDGIGRHRGQAVFVPLTAPGDLVRCRVVERKRNFLRAELVDLVEAGEGRCEPRCPVYGRCGGCQWQHLSYPTQAQWKERLFAEIMSRQLKCENLPLLPGLTALQPWNYRSRVQFKCHAAGKDVAIGFFRRGSHHVEQIRECPIAATPINQALSWLQENLPRVERPDRIPQVDVGIGDRGTSRLLVHDLSLSGEAVGRVLGPAAVADDLALFVQSGKKKNLLQITGSATLQIRVDDPPLWLGYGPGGFAQVHLEQNRCLVNAVLDLAGLKGGEKVLDLFCGMGNLSLPLARRAARVDGVEAYAPAILQARVNAEENAIDNAAFYSADAVSFLARTKTSYDLVVLDPPRSGAREIIDSLLTHAPQRILYISCDPMTLARDLRILLDNGYRLAAARVADLFPQTYHLECLALLERV